MLRRAIMTLLATSVAATLQAQDCFDINLGTDLNLSDDGVVSALPLGFTFNYGGVAYTDICVCSNGFLWLGATPPAVNPGDFSPTEAELLSAPPRLAPLWIDLNPAAAGSGHVFFDNSTPGFARVTWQGVYQFGTTNPVDMQVALDVSGSVTVTYGTNPANIGAGLVGASVGNGAAANPVSLATRPAVIGQDTFSEVLASGAFPYAGGQMGWLPSSPGWLVLDNVCTMNSIAGAKFETVGNGCPGGGAALNAGDDTTHLVNLPFSFPHNSGPYSDIYVSSNGFLTFGAVNPGSGCCSGNVGTMLAGQPRVAGFWQDLNASNTSTSGNGDVETGVDPATGDFLVTWRNIGEFGDTTPAANNFQIALGQGGEIKIRYLNVSISSATRVAVCGYSDGLGALDPGATDLSANANGVLANTIYESFSNTGNPIDLSGLDFLLLPAGPTGYIVVPGGAGPFAEPLTLRAAPGSVPAVGSTFQLDVAGIAPAPNGIYCALLLGLEIPPVDLGIINAPGCSLMLALPELGSFLNIPLGAPTTSFSLPIPPSPSFVGIELMSQVASDDPNANGFGWRISNGGRWTFGL